MAFQHRILFATDLAANFGCYRFRITPDFVSKLLRTAIWSRCPVRLESEQTPFPWTGRQFRPAALDRIRFGTCSFVPMSYFYSETNDWAKPWVLLCSATISRQLHRNFISHQKQSDSLLPEIYKVLKPCWLLTLGRRFAAALLPRLFGTNPRSHHKGATDRVRTGDQRLPGLCHCQLGQDIPYSVSQDW